MWSEREKIFFHRTHTRSRVLFGRLVPSEHANTCCAGHSYVEVSPHDVSWYDLSLIHDQLVYHYIYVWVIAGVGPWIGIKALERRTQDVDTINRIVRKIIIYCMDDGRADSITDCETNKKKK